MALLPMRVLFEEHAGPQRAGGIEAATRGLVESLAKEGVVVNRHFTDVPQTIGAVPDCVHIHGIWSPALAWRFIHWRRRGVPCVVTVHGMLEPWALAHKRLKKRVAWQLYQKCLLNRASALHATSEREAANLRKLGLRPKIEIIPWGIEVPLFDRNTGFQPVMADSASCLSANETTGWKSVGQDRQDAYPPSSLPSAIPCTALFVGRIYPVKGLPMLVEAWAQVRPVGWKMRIVGPDEAGHRAEVEALVRKAGLEEVFEFTGALDGEALHQAYAAADLFMLPSHTENFGMVVGEALAHGLPVIATQGSPWNGLLDHACGWWTGISSDGIASALQAATALDPTELRTMGARGRQWMKTDFSWDQCAGRMAELYRSIA